MRVSRTRFSKRRLKRKTSFPIVAVVQKKRKTPSRQSGSFSMLRKERLPERGLFSRTERSNQGSEATRREGSALARNKEKKRDEARVEKKSRATIDYKNIILLRSLITAEGKILPRRISKLSAKQQRYVQKAIKSARVMGLLPFINKSRPF